MIIIMGNHNQICCCQTRQVQNDPNHLFLKNQLQNCSDFLLKKQSDSLDKENKLTQVSRKDLQQINHPLKQDFKNKNDDQTFNKDKKDDQNKIYQTLLQSRSSLFVDLPHYKKESDRQNLNPEAQINELAWVNGKTNSLNRQLLSNPQEYVRLPLNCKHNQISQSFQEKQSEKSISKPQKVELLINKEDNENLQVANSGRSQGKKSIIDLNISLSDFSQSEQFLDLTSINFLESRR